MKRIIFIRHGKSSWEYEVADKFRPLNQKGLEDAPLVAKEFKRKRVLIDAVFSSPASRALSSCCMFIETLGLPYQMLKIENLLYDFSREGVLEFITMLPNNLNSIAIFGHNNALTNIVNQLGDINIERVPTSGIVSLFFSIDNWKTLSKGHTEFFITPKGIRTL